MPTKRTCICCRHMRLVGLHISRNLNPHLNLLLRVDNLTDERVPQVYGYPVLGTTFSVRLTAK